MQIIYEKLLLFMVSIKQIITSVVSLLSISSDFFLFGLEAYFVNKTNFCLKKWNLFFCNNYCIESKSNRCSAKYARRHRVLHYVSFTSLSIKLDHVAVTHNHSTLLYQERPSQPKPLMPAAVVTLSYNIISLTRVCW